MGPESKKRKLAHHPHAQPVVDTSKPTAVFTSSKGRHYTVSVALPGSIIANAQTHDQKTALAGNIARACAVFCVDEIVIFSDGPAAAPPSSRQNGYNSYAADDAASGYTAFSDPAQFLEHVLSYLETPPHLRRTLFLHHPNLRTAGSLQSVDMPHHLKQEEWCQYREGISTGSSDSTHPNGHTDEPPSSKKSKKSNKKPPTNTPEATQFTTINTGLPNPVTIPLSLPANTRVTVKFADSHPPASPSTPLQATAVSPAAPREEAGYYWGYSVRRAESLSAVFTESPWPEGYDFCIGTSERGVTLDDFLAQHPPLKTVESPPSDSASDADAESSDDDDDEKHEQRASPSWSHLLLTFGGVAGLEKALAHDTTLLAKGVADPKDLFDAYLNLVPQQGSRTIRTEEAVWCGLMGLRGWVLGNGGG